MKMKQPKNLDDLWLDGLRDMYDAENQLIKAIPKLIEEAASPQLQAALRGHLEETEEHADRIEQIFTRLDVTDRTEKCEGMKGLLREGEELIKGRLDSSVRDAALIAAAQKVEHYEIAGYGTLCAWAKLLGKNDAAMLLTRSLEEEKKSDAVLTRLATEGINDDARAAA